LRLTEDRGLILHTIDCKGFRLILYAEVDVSYMFHADSKGHTGYCIGFDRVGFFWYNCQKQTMVCISSTQAEMRALCTLVNDLIYLIDLCQELKMPLDLPAIVMEDNAAVIQIATEECAMMKRCKQYV
jgi:hypothetical protein